MLDSTFSPTIAIDPEKAGEQENAVQLASQIIRMEEKVPTTAAREIKEEMSDFINNSQPEASQ
ncbi:hypothetical protein [Natronogracilivirga saccharolytica]|uniref:Uncharacterized protein n=1 Tax=Natronogracilivirga saccharolytica TaxID=2812953 RepID=A0A8J7RJI7_9BACT|nr:hypothetical protein [Natronogracilivirga saccharolytica]MBP3192895.1 hypothetical protein [Natronogracilivirga saccharolytica]